MKMLITLITTLVVASVSWAEESSSIAYADYTGNAEDGRLVFAQCRTCHYPEVYIGHHNGPSLHAIFGKVAGKQAGFDEYSDTFKNAQFEWTPELLFVWLGDVDGMFPETTMMSLGVPDPQQRADLIEYLERFK